MYMETWRYFMEAFSNLIHKQTNVAVIVRRITPEGHTDWCAKNKRHEISWSLFWMLTKFQGTYIVAKKQKNLINWGRFCVVGLSPSQPTQSIWQKKMGRNSQATLVTLSWACLVLLSAVSHQPVASSTPPPKVTVDYYYETLCGGCAYFFVEDLINLFETGLDSIVDLRLHPSGNSVILPDGTVICQVLALPLPPSKAPNFLLLLFFFFIVNFAFLWLP